LAALPITSDHEIDNSPVSKSWFLPIIFFIIVVTLALKGGFTSFLTFCQRLWSPNIWLVSWFKITLLQGRLFFVTAVNQAMPGEKLDLKNQEDNAMSAWVIFFFGGTMGFCLGIICLILMMALGESEICLEQSDIREP
jgi:hypothetical protein